MSTALWSWYDRRTGKRATIVTWLDQRRCGEDLGAHLFAVWVRGKRPDVTDMVEHLVVRQVIPGDWPPG